MWTRIRAAMALATLLALWAPVLASMAEWVKSIIVPTNSVQQFSNKGRCK